VVGALVVAAALATVSPGAVAAGPGTHSNPATTGTGQGTKHMTRHRGPAINLRTPAAVKRYLRSRGFDPRTFVIQIGRRNYAGPNCPGRGWHCTRATRVFQLAAAGGSNVGECTGQAPPGPGATQSCVIMQSSPTGNDATCSEQTDSPAADETCDISQTSDGGDNHAVASQAADNQIHGSTQTAQQKIRIRQTSGSGQNVATWQQTIHFVSQDHVPSSAESQDGHQVSLIDQTSSSGDSSSKGTQFEHFSQDAHGTSDITQAQNTNESPFTGPPEPAPLPTPLVAPTDCHPDPTFPANLETQPHICALVSQDSGSGRLSSDVNQMMHLQLNAHADGTITQTQGRTDGGLDLGVDQHSHGLATNHNTQHEHFQANGAAHVNLRQFQHGPLSHDGSPDPDQSDNPNDRADADQMSKLEESGTSQPTLDSLLIDDLTLLANDESALLDALSQPLLPLPLQEEGNVSEQDSTGSLHYSTSGNATGSTDFSTDTGHATDRESGPAITIDSFCGGLDPPPSSTGTCTSGPPTD
jgi:hypothetical protein